MSHHFIAVDLGASSGRAMLAALADGKLSLSEAHRFDNGPVPQGDSLRWDLDALTREVRRGVELARDRVPGRAPDGVACDSWGVDYVLLGEGGLPLANPHHYRDRRTDGVMERACHDFGRERIFERTGVQFLPFNTLYQVMTESPETLRRAHRLVMIADYFNFVLGGEVCAEATIAGTTQMVDPRARAWQPDMVAAASPNAPLLRKLPRIVEAGTLIGDGLGFPVYASASHDTAAAVAGCPGQGDDWAFLSSGTWSILGVELPAPVVTPEALAADLSNELGVEGTTRLLKNIMGLWPLQQCREEWRAAGSASHWGDILAAAEKAPALSAVIDPDDARFLPPGDMQGRIAAFCRETGQRAPESVGEFARVILESLALKCRAVVESVERVTGRRIRVINMVGGGTQNRLLCRFTADACARTVVAGPVEATAIGNVLVQARAVGAVKNLAEAREVIRRSFAPDVYEPRPTRAWEDAYGTLKSLCAQ